MKQFSILCSFILKLILFFSFSTTALGQNPPLIHTESPTNNAIGIDIKPTLSITFDKEVVIANNGTFNIYKGTTLIRKYNLATAAHKSLFSLSTDEKTLSLQLPDALPLNSFLTIAIDAGFVKDKLGTDFAGFTESSGTWGFTTAEKIIRYVKTENDGGSAGGDGKSWTTASSNLQAMIDAVHAEGEGEVWVAKGTYISPIVVKMFDDDGFAMRSNVEIYGGFSGGETLRSQRDWKNNVTILSGNNNARVINNLSRDLDNNAILDGFILTNGRNISDGVYRAKRGFGGGVFSYASPTFRNLIITGNIAEWGAGMCLEEGSPIIENVVISNNIAFDGGNLNGGIGGGMFIFYSAPEIKNSTISGNKSLLSSGGVEVNTNSHPVFTNVLITGNESTLGGGMSVYYSDPGFESKATLVNTTISGNYALYDGGGIYTPDSKKPDLTMVNCIVWGNGNGKKNYSGGKPKSGSSNNLIEGLRDYNTVNGKVYNGKAADIFVNPVSATENNPITGGDYTLTTCSPAINAGDNSKYPQNAELTDLAGKQRITLATIDLGPYEFQDIPEPRLIMPADKTYKIGDELLFTVNYFKSVNVNGNPELPLTVGSAAKSAVYKSISQNQQEVTFSYTVAEGDEDTNGIEIGTINLNDGSILDNGNPAQLTYCPISSTGIKIDGKRPAITASKIASDNTNTTLAKIGNTVTLTFTSSEAVNTPQVFIAGKKATVSAAVRNSTTQWKAIYKLTETETEGDVTFVISMTDKNGNAALDVTTTTDNSKVTFDKTAPEAPVITSPEDETTLYQAKFTIKGTAEANSVITLYWGTTVLSSAILADNEGKWHYDMETEVSDGMHTFYAVATDIAGNSSANSTTVSLVVNTSPIILVNGNMTGMNTTYGTASTAVVFKVGGINLLGDVLITAPSGFELSADNATYTNTLPLVDVEELVDVYIRLSAKAPVGTDFGGEVLLKSKDAENKSITIPTSVVQPKSLNITANDTEKTYGDELTLEGTEFITAGLVNEDKVNKVTFSSAGFAKTAEVGGSPYDIVASSAVGTGLNNYTIHYLNGNLSIKKKQLTITADDKEKFAGTPNPELTASYNGFVNGENEQVLTSLPTVTTIADINSPIDNYPITVSGASAKNYQINYVPGTLKVKPGAPTAINLASITLYENRPAGTLAGTFNSTSDDPNATFTYSLVTGSGDKDNASFTIIGNQLQTAGQLDYEAQKEYQVRVRSTTQHGFWLEKEFVIELEDVNEAPTLDEIASQTICYTTTEQQVNLSGITAGPESGQTITITASSSNPALLSSLTLNNNSQLRYRVANGQTGTTIVTVKVKDNGGTENGGLDETTRTFMITVNPLPVNSITSDKGNKVSKGETAILSVSSDNGISYSWSSVSGIISGQNSAQLTVRPMETTTYTVTVRNTSGCERISSYTLEVETDYLAVQAENFITPNGDGVNDTWVINNIDAYPNHTLTIVDRAGREVYKVRNYQNDWNGTFDGKPLVEGTYYYILRFDEQPNLRMVKGFITIVRN